MIFRLSMSCCFLLMCLLFSTCKVEPQAISYNEDQCHSCKMIISDSRFGSELVTSKGKVYKYDAIECMVREVIAQGESKYAHILVSDFLNPGHFLDARSAFYLIHKDRPSPMGADLSAYVSTKALKTNFTRDDEKVLRWDALKNQYAEK